ncbi:uncharacterized protein RSE6_05179 [Rhynchosporium secalis]|uniref:Hydroxymethylglutaryl-CoA reductase (NADPH) n=1 Tax=Rhynchosporium secalis TaxID=38038 RepID=A0A1E1M759_RHYSE|nr:uncharacterized protein RSE6_05179 [Rhynchosporium secalis]
MSISSRTTKEPIIINLIHQPSRTLSLKEEKAASSCLEPSGSLEGIKPDTNLAAQIRSLPNVSQSPAATSNTKIENCVGFVSVPISFAGPLTLIGTYQTQKTFSAPLATLEPLIVAVCSHGCKVFSACGGISTSALQEGFFRAAVFTFSNIAQALKFSRQVPTLLTHLQTAAKKASSHGELVSGSPRIMGSKVRIKFTYICDDAA